jgi:hypothetical protein
MNKTLVNRKVDGENMGKNVYTNLFRSSCADDWCLRIASKCRFKNENPVPITIGKMSPKSIVDL